MILNKLKFKIKLNSYLKKMDKGVIAIDGSSLSGKSFLSNKIKNKYKDKVEIIHMDDFYLDKKNKNHIYFNLDKIDSYFDGNIDYPRLKNEVIDKVLNKDINSFSYRIYDPIKEKYFLKEIKNKNKKIIIIEGSYSLNPILGKYYDLSIFLYLNYKKQNYRLKKREDKKIDDFKNIWFKLEKNYFSKYKVIENVDLVRIN